LTTDGTILNCNVCEAPLGEALFIARADRSITSLCELRKGRAHVWLCAACGHLRGRELEDAAAYYETGYRILIDHEDEDQIYDTPAGGVVYRTDHQVATLLDKLPLAAGAKLLDYGCAKAATPRKLLARRADLEVHVFDVSEMYKPFWDTFLPAERQAIHQLPADWQGRFDVVTSFFALEHIAAPLDTVRRIARLLKDGGTFYGIVPDTFGNVADFVVVDHVNHFTAPSLHKLLALAGFTRIEIDAGAHRGALVFTAQRTGTPSSLPEVAPAIARAMDIAGYWSAVDGRIRAAESAQAHAPAAIYGSGFYGAYIANALHEPQRIACFLDRSPYQQGKTLFGKPVLAPEELPADVRVLYVGLNPAIARAAMAQLSWLQARGLRLVFLDGEAA
jgi:SAM-dependent methyltransferase